MIEPFKDLWAREPHFRGLIGLMIVLVVCVVLLAYLRYQA